MPNELTTQEQQLAKIKEIMGAKTPSVFIEQREGRGGKTFDYVEIGYVKAKLNQYFPFGWSHKMTLITPIESALILKQIVVNVDLTITDHAGHEIVHSGQGGGALKYKQGTNELVDFADDLKSAEADALKKAASFCIAFDVYHPNVVEKFDEMKTKALAQAGKKTAQTTTPTIETPKIEVSGPTQPIVDTLQSGIDKLKGMGAGKIIE